MDDDDTLTINLPENMAELAIFAFEDEPEGSINITLSATYLYKLATKAYPKHKIVYDEDTHLFN